MSKVDMEQYVKDALRTDCNYEAALLRLQDIRTVKLLHMVIGLADEVGELSGAIKKHIFYGKPIDVVNIKEELGDVTWYERIGIAALETRYQEILDMNIAKLKQRYPEKFTEHAALNRDLETERSVLERETHSPTAQSIREERCLCGGVGCNRCEPRGNYNY